MNSKRPIIKLIQSTSDKWLNGVSLLGIIFVWIYTIINYTKLPAIIPVHFNASGAIDRYGNKIVLFILPGIITLVIAGLAWLGRYPHIFNYPTTITPQNAKREYSRAVRLLRIIQFVIVAFTVVIMFSIIAAAKTNGYKLAGWILPAFIAAMIIPVIFSVTASFRKKKIVS